MQILALLATLAASSLQPLDHNGDPREVARASYRAADDAEAIANRASYSCRGGYQLAASADRLHYALSDLYRAARNAGGGFPRAGAIGIEDHNGPFGRLFEIVEDAFRRVQSDFSAVGYYCDGNVQNLYRSLQYDYTYLEQVIGSGGPGPRI